MAAALLAAMSVALVACASGGPQRPPGPPTTYPAPVPDFGRQDRFPLAVAGFQRGVVLSYAPGLADYSIAYDRRDADVDENVVLHFYPRMNDEATQLHNEELEVLQSHPDARVVSRRPIVLEREGARYDAQLVSFAFDARLHGAWQPVSSQLVVVFRALGTFKARSTAPLAQAAGAERALLELLRGVAWESPGAFIGG